MVAENLVGEIGGKFVERLFSGVVYLTIGLVLAGILFGLVWYFIIYKRKFDIKVKVKSDRAGDKFNILFDKAAIIEDRKTKTKFFRLWSIRKELPVPKFNIIQSSTDGDYIELYRTGEDKFYFLPPSKVSKIKVMKEDGKIYGIAESESIKMDIDLDYWAAKRKQDNKSMFDMDSLFMKLLPFMPAVFSGVLMMFILYILLDHLPGILSQLQELYRLQSNVCQAAVITG